MAIKKLEDGLWRADIRPSGAQGKRYRKTFKSKTEAQRWSAWLTTKKGQEKEWEPRKKRDSRTLTDLINTWKRLHGDHLKDGEKRYKKLLFLADNIGNPTIDKFTTQHFTEYRQRRIEEGASPNTVNHEQAYLRAVFNELKRLGEVTVENPLAKIRQLKLDEKELSFLSHDEIDQLLTELDNGNYRDAAHIARICLATGARWTEAETLEGKQIRDGRITFGKTKSGKPRTVPVNGCVHRLIENRKGRLFVYSYDDFRRAIKATGLEIPAGQSTHILRHTFASHFMMNGGNILTLQKILGHSTLTMTIRYAHLSPDHLQEAANLNPLN